MKKNGLEPNHVTVHSKFKEFFGLSIAGKEWAEFVEKAALDANFLHTLNHYEQLIGGLTAECKNGTLLFGLKGENWVGEDSKEVESDSKDYLLFLSRIEQFFTS